MSVRLRVLDKVRNIVVINVGCRVHVSSTQSARCGITAIVLPATYTASRRKQAEKKPIPTTKDLHMPVNIRTIMYTF